MRVIGLPVIFATVLLVLAMAHGCCQPCQFSSTKRAGLTKHQGLCAIYRTSQTLRMEQRKAKVCDLQMRKERILQVEAYLFFTKGIS
jgi:hypothetical protein